LDPGSEIRDPGWVKIRIRDKHPGSATLLPTKKSMYGTNYYSLRHKEIFEKSTLPVFIFIFILVEIKK
jgi:hypothetical protein